MNFADNLQSHHEPIQLLMIFNKKFEKHILKHAFPVSDIYRIIKPLTFIDQNRDKRMEYPSIRNVEVVETETTEWSLYLPKLLFRPQEK